MFRPKIWVTLTDDQGCRPMNAVDCLYVNSHKHLCLSSLCLSQAPPFIWQTVLSTYIHTYIHTHTQRHTYYTHLSHQFTYRNKQRNKTTETNQQQQRRANSRRVLEFTPNTLHTIRVKRIPVRITGVCNVSGNQTSIKKEITQNENFFAAINYFSLMCHKWWGFVDCGLKCGAIYNLTYINGSTPCIQNVSLIGIWRSADRASWYIGVQLTVHRDILAFSWQCIVIYWRSADRASWYTDVQLTVHRDILTFSWQCIVIYWRSADRASWYILIIKQTRRTKFSNLFLQ